MSEQTQKANKPGLAAGIDWVAKHWPRARLAHEGMMLDKINRQNRIAEIDARNAMTGKHDDTEGWPDQEDDSMGVDIGDSIVHNHYPPPQAAPQPPQEPRERSPWIPLAAGAAIAVAAYMGAKWLDKPPPPPPATPPVVEAPADTPPTYYRPQYMRHGVGVDPPKE